MDIQQLKSLKILVVGDYCKDIFKYGFCNRLSPEAPVPVFVFNYETQTDGMAGNVFNNLKALNVNVELLVSNKETVKERFVDIKSRQHLLRVDYEKKPLEIEIDIFKLNIYDAIIISDYNKGSITNSVIKKIISNYSGIVFVDSKKQDLSIFDSEKCIIKINQQEFEKATNFPKKSKLIVTLGSDGAKMDGIIYPTKKIEVFDVSGAGDSFISGLATQYLLTKKFDDAINFANICATNVVKKTGTSIIDFEEVKDDLCF